MSNKDRKQDSLLAQALRDLDNDLLIYNIDDNKTSIHSLPLFVNAVEGEGLVKFERSVGLISNMRPLSKIDGKIHESIALKISFAVKESLPIEYSRTLDKYIHINGSDIIDLPISEFPFSNKIILVGYIGPTDENKFRTPLRFIEKKNLNIISQIPMAL